MKNEELIVPKTCWCGEAWSRVSTDAETIDFPVDFILTSTAASWSMTLTCCRFHVTKYERIPVDVFKRIHNPFQQEEEMEKKPKRVEITAKRTFGRQEGVEVYIVDGLVGRPEKVIVEGDYVIKEIDPNNYVQVEFAFPREGYPKGSLYTYIDPGFGLKTGDVVNVPTRYKQSNLAVVKKLGDGFEGNSHAFVNYKYEAGDPIE